MAIVAACPARKTAATMPHGILLGQNEDGMVERIALQDHRGSQENGL